MIDVHTWPWPTTPRSGDCVGSEKAPGASLTVSAFCDLIDFIASDLWASVVNDDSLSGMDSRDFAAMEGLTKLTQPGLEVV
jgi:hypothetical protein